MIDISKLVTILIEGGAFISALAAIVATLIMMQATKKFGTGVLAAGFKSIAIGVFFIAMGIFADAIQSYVLKSNFVQLQQWVTYILLVKQALFVIGTYIIVIGSKKTGDKLESLTK